MHKIALIATVLLFAFICALVLLIGFQSPRKPNISIAFLGYTNGMAGSRLARFAVSNSEASAVQVWAPFICIQTPTNVIAHSVPGMMVIRAGASKLLTVPPPTDQSPWRIHLRVDPDVGAWREIKHFVLYGLLKVGLKPRFQSMPYGIDGDWIESDG